MSSGSGVNTRTASSQKKRALEALQQRFAYEAERLQENPHQSCLQTNPTSNSVVVEELWQDESRTLQARVAAEVKRPLQESKTLKRAPNPYDSVFEKQTSHPNASAPTSSKKDAVHSVYSEISGIVNRNLLPADNLQIMKDLSARDNVGRILNDIVGKSEEDNKYKRGKRLRLDSWILLDNYVAKDDNLKNARIKALKSYSKRSTKHMSRREHKKCGSFDLPKEFHNFDLFKTMHEMWKQYIAELVQEVRKPFIRLHFREKQVAERLLTADLHGAFLIVVECKTSAFKGACGIMIRETAETFGIITQDSHFRVVLKVGSVFIFQADCWKMTLHGDKLSKRMIEQKSTRH